jgi:hypothetical protein
MRKSIAMLTSTLALATSLSANEGEKSFHLQGGEWQLFGFNEEIDLKETFVGHNIKILYTYDNVNLNWLGYSTEYAMRVALEDANYTVVDRVPPNQGFWVKSYEDSDITVVPYSPIIVESFDPHIIVDENDTVETSIDLSSKLGDTLVIDVKSDTQVFTAISQETSFTTGTEAGVTLHLDVTGNSLGADQFSVIITDISGDHNYTKELFFDVSVELNSTN